MLCTQRCSAKHSGGQAQGFLTKSENPGHGDFKCAVPCCADSATGLTDRPRPHEDEVRFILEAISEYLTVKVRRSDVLSAWAGIRPLAQDPNASSTEAASRDHIVTRDADGLLTVTGPPLPTCCAPAC